MELLISLMRDVIAKAMHGRIYFGLLKSQVNFLTN